MDLFFCMNNFHTISFLADGDLNVLDDILTMDDDFDDEKDEKKEQHSGKVFQTLLCKMYTANSIRNMLLRRKITAEKKTIFRNYQICCGNKRESYLNPENWRFFYLNPILNIVLC